MVPPGTLIAVTHGGSLVRAKVLAVVILSCSITKITSSRIFGWSSRRRGVSRWLTIALSLNTGTMMEILDRGVSVERPLYLKLASAPRCKNSIVVVSFSVMFAARVRVPRRAKTKNVTAGAKAPVMATSAIKLHKAICKILKFRSWQLSRAAQRAKYLA